MRGGLYLIGTVLRNRFVTQLRQLRRARGALGFAAVAGYLWLLLDGDLTGGPFANAFSGNPRPAFSALGLGLLVATWWLTGRELNALAFSPAELHFLFPAPWTRRQLVAYKLLRAQFPLLLQALFWMLLLAGARSELPLALRGIAIWSLLTTMYLHAVAAGLVRSSATRHGRAGIRRHRVSVAIFSAAALLLIVHLARALPWIAAADSGGEGFARIGDVLRDPLPQALFFPIRVALGPVLAPDLAQWAHAIGPALLLLALHVVWVLRTDAAFEDAAVDASVAWARRRAAGGAPPVRGDVRDTWLRLAPTGMPAVAIVWKNLVSATRRFRVAPLLIAGASLIAAVGTSGGMRDGSLGEIMASALTIWAALLIGFGPALVRADLRQDLPRLGLLRTYPLSTRALVAAELASSTIIIVTLQLVLLAAARGAAWGSPEAFVIAGAREVAVMLLCLPALSAAGVAIHNGLALAAPTWSRLGPGNEPGVATMGQNAIAGLGALIGLGLTLILPLILGYSVALAVRAATGSPDVAIAAGLMVGTGVLWGEVALFIRILARRLDRLEVGVLAG